MVSLDVGIESDGPERRAGTPGSDSILAGLPQPLDGGADRFSGRRAAAGRTVVMGSRPLGLVLVLVGAAVVVIGLLVWSGALSWFGRLPGDFRIERENVKVYFPITSMILISLVLTLLINLLRKLF
jgi:Protein of unknown function (DUF2905)